MVLEAHALWRAHSVCAPMSARLCACVQWKASDRSTLGLEVAREVSLANPLAATSPPTLTVGVASRVPAASGSGAPALAKWRVDSNGLVGGVLGVIWGRFRSGRGRYGGERGSNHAVRGSKSCSEMGPSPALKWGPKPAVQWVQILQ